MKKEKGTSDANSGLKPQDLRLRFVVLQHTDSMGVHYDIMLEKEGALETWKAMNPPNYYACHPSFAQKIANHRTAYLDYEGEISGNRGKVTRWDKGTYRIIERTENRLTVYLTGQKGSGTFNFIRRPVKDDENAWIIQRCS
ncbi:MAG: hypothetical protein HZA48_06050 [Planctomycetes bacterium]|nr:hypothetical protein [Planctomycetota bacterium]